MTVRIHLERVSLDTRLYGLVKLTKSLVSLPLRGFVLWSFSFMQVQTQRDGLAGYALKTTGYAHASSYLKSSTQL